MHTEERFPDQEEEKKQKREVLEFLRKGRPQSLRFLGGLEHKGQRPREAAKPPRGELGLGG